MGGRSQGDLQWLATYAEKHALAEPYFALGMKRAHQPHRGFMEMEHMRSLTEW